MSNTKSTTKTTTPTTSNPDLSHLPTTSSKIRYLTGLGWKRGPIAKLLGIRYQHVRNVQLQPLKKTT